MAINFKSNQLDEASIKALGNYNIGDFQRHGLTYNQACDIHSNIQKLKHQNPHSWNFGFEKSISPQMNNAWKNGRGKHNIGLQSNSNIQGFKHFEQNSPNWHANVNSNFNPITFSTFKHIHFGGSNNLNSQGTQSHGYNIGDSHNSGNLHSKGLNGFGNFKVQKNFNFGHQNHDSQDLNNFQNPHFRGSLNIGKSGFGNFGFSSNSNSQSSLNLGSNKGETDNSKNLAFDYSSNFNSQASHNVRSNNDQTNNLKTAPSEGFGFSNNLNSQGTLNSGYNSDVADHSKNVDSGNFGYSINLNSQASPNLGSSSSNLNSQASLNSESNNDKTDRLKNVPSVGFGFSNHLNSQATLNSGYNNGVTNLLKNADSGNFGYSINFGSQASPNVGSSSQGAQNTTTNNNETDYLKNVAFGNFGFSSQFNSQASQNLGSNNDQTESPKNARFKGFGFSNNLNSQATLDSVYNSGVTDHSKNADSGSFDYSINFNSHASQNVGSNNDQTESLKNAPFGGIGFSNNLNSQTSVDSGYNSDHSKNADSGSFGYSINFNSHASTNVGSSSSNLNSQASLNSDSYNNKTNGLKNGKFGSSGYSNNWNSQATLNSGSGSSNVNSQETQDRETNNKYITGVHKSKNWTTNQHFDKNHYNVNLKQSTSTVLPLVTPDLDTLIDMVFNKNPKSQELSYVSGKQKPSSYNNMNPDFVFPGKSYRTPHLDVLDNISYRSENATRKNLYNLREAQKNFNILRNNTSYKSEDPNRSYHHEASNIVFPDWKKSNNTRNLYSPGSLSLFDIRSSISRESDNFSQDTGSFLYSGNNYGQTDFNISHKLEEPAREKLSPRNNSNILQTPYLFSSGKPKNSSYNVGADQISSQGIESFNSNMQQIMKLQSLGDYIPVLNMRPNGFVLRNVKKTNVSHGRSENDEKSTVIHDSIIATTPDGVVIESQNRPTSKRNKLSVIIFDEVTKTHLFTSDLPKRTVRRNNADVSGNLRKSFEDTTEESDEFASYKNGFDPDLGLTTPSEKIKLPRSTPEPFSVLSKNPVDSIELEELEEFDPNENDFSPDLVLTTPSEKIKLPRSTQEPIAVLSENPVDSIALEESEEFDPYENGFDPDLGLTTPSEKIKLPRSTPEPFSVLSKNPVDSIELEELEEFDPNENDFGPDLGLTTPSEKIKLPRSTQEPIAVLSENPVDSIALEKSEEFDPYENGFDPDLGLTTPSEKIKLPRSTKEPISALSENRSKSIDLKESEVFDPYKNNFDTESKLNIPSQDPHKKNSIDNITVHNNLRVNSFVTKFPQNNHSNDPENSGNGDGPILKLSPNGFSFTNLKSNKSNGNTWFKIKYVDKIKDSKFKNN